MVDYYEKRRQALIIVDEMYKNGKDPDMIELKISTMFGFSRKMIDERIRVVEKCILKTG